MCGVAGIISAPNLDRTNLLSKMVRSLAHRGPDGEGIWISSNGRVELGHRRLSIIDLSAAAGQPFESIDKRFVLTYNGEIYNFLELRTECERLGSRFVSRSDTEVVIESYRHWGVECFARFQGMWALALYDSVENKMVLSRDHFGIKPLYYGQSSGRFYFASEIKALRVADAQFAVPDEASVRLFQESGILDRKSWTFFENVHRFPQGHYAQIDLSADLDRLKCLPYWKPSVASLDISFQDAVSEFKRLFHRSIELHLRSDVPVGSCLSGGLDSSSIVAMASAGMDKSQVISTFTTRFPEHPEIDESKWARMVNKVFHTRDHWIEPRYEDFDADFGRLLEVQDEPFGSASVYSQYSVFKMVGRSGVKVVLDGQGADEVLGGYEGLRTYFRADFRLRRRWDLLADQVVRELFDPSIKWNFSIRRSPTNKNDQKQPQEGLVITSNSEVEDRVQERRAQLFRPFSGVNDHLRDMILDSNLPQLLRYEDRNSMAFSVESRVPFLYVPLVEFAMALPPEFKMRRGYQKAILREAIGSLLPDEIRWRRNKLGFPAPEEDWISRRFGVRPAGAGSHDWRKIVVDLWRCQIGASEC